MNELIGKIWPGWEIDELIGRGAYGQVYRIRRSDVGEVAYGALKVMRIPSDEREIQSLMELGMNDTEMYTYLRGTVNDIVSEITLMERLKGAPNVVSIEDYYLLEHKDGPAWTIFIRMELLESLSHYIKRIGLPDPEGAVRMGIDILKALESCEQQRIIHRDIKPDNIFISRFGEFKLGDFGIARQMEAGSRASYTQKGTLSYMAPEMVRGDHYDNTVDIYSLGIVLYRYLNQNRFPFLPLPPAQITQLDMEEAYMRRVSGELLPPPVMADRSLAAIIETACDPEPSRRYQSAGEFRQALSDWLSGIRTDPSDSGFFAKILTVILVLTVLALIGIGILRWRSGRQVSDVNTDTPSVTAAPVSEADEVFDYSIYDYSFSDASHHILAAIVENKGSDPISFTVQFQPKTKTDQNEVVSMHPVEVPCDVLEAGESRFLCKELNGSDGDVYDWDISLEGVRKTEEKPSIRLSVELNEPVPEEPLVNQTLSYLVRNTGSTEADLSDVTLYLYVKYTDGTFADVITKQPTSVVLAPGRSEPAVFLDESIEGSYDPEVFWGVPQ